ncbi:MAG: DUF6512 family protein, partial [Bacillota bacterium]|nr:DUF6512 family protein [Bacillota bacterium]
MKNTCTLTTTKIFIHTIILGIAACFSHFAYKLSGENIIVGLFNPVNESVWEHLKFMFFPFLLWWIAMYLIKNKKSEIPLNTWIVSAAASLVAAPLSVVLLYYSYTGALGIESVLIDILLTFVCYFIALCVASHFLKYSEPDTRVVIISVIVIAVIFIA